MTQPIIGPEGLPLTLEELPSPQAKRWVSRMKAEVVVAVEAGLLTMRDACVRYRMSPEEFLAWQAAFSRHGMVGLRVTKRQPAKAGGQFSAGCS